MELVQVDIDKIIKNSQQEFIQYQKEKQERQMKPAESEIQTFNMQKFNSLIVKGENPFSITSSNRHKLISIQGTKNNTYL